MRSQILSILLLSCTGVVHTGEIREIRQADRIRVYVYAGDKTYGFADQDTLDSVKDLKKALDREPTIPKVSILTVVETKAAAEVCVHVFERGKVGTGDYTVQPEAFGGASARERKVKQVAAELVVGDYSTFIVGSDKWAWSNAAEELGDKIVKWLKANRERVLAMRLEKK